MSIRTSDAVAKPISSHLTFFPTNAPVLGTLLPSPDPEVIMTTAGTIRAPAILSRSLGFTPSHMHNREGEWLVKT